MTTTEQLSARINDAFRNRDHGTHAALLTLREAVARDAEELNQLRRWKREQLTVTAWWDEIDAFVRKHPDGIVGRDVSALALEWLHERDRLKASLVIAKAALRVIAEC